MMTIKRFFVLLFLLINTSALADKRVALVIGNGAYSSVAPLANPRGDSAAMAALFKDAGFDVVQVIQDVDSNDMKRAIRDFSALVVDADIAAIYYAGHGIEVDGVNYVLPVDVKLQRDLDVEDEGIAVDRFMRVLEPAKRLRLVILDACRDNPFARTMKRTIASRSVGRGLAKIEPMTSDTLIAFAAKAGSTAADGEGSHSPFTTALLNHLASPGLDLRLALGRVRDEVLASTGRNQEPFVYGSLGGSVVSLVPPREEKAEPPNDPDAIVRRDYELAAEVGSKELWDSFLAKHAKGFYADLARAQRAKAIAAEKASAEAAEAKRKAETAARATEGSDKSSERERASIAEKAKLEAEAKERKAAAAELARRQAAERAKVATQDKLKNDQRSAAISPDATRSLSPASSGFSNIVKQEPPGGTLAYGSVLLVDDGSCPRGKIKQITGGNNQMNIDRQRRCVTR